MKNNREQQINWDVVRTLVGADMTDYDGNPMKRGTYIRVKDGVEYSISGVERYKFHASTAQFDHVVPAGGTDAILYVLFARELKRLENKAA